MRLLLLLLPLALFSSERQSSEKPNNFYLQCDTGLFSSNEITFIFPESTIFVFDNPIVNSSIAYQGYFEEIYVSGRESWLYSTDDIHVFGQHPPSNGGIRRFFGNEYLTINRENLNVALKVRKRSVGKPSITVEEISLKCEIINKDDAIGFLKKYENRNKQEKESSKKKNKI